MNSLLSPLSKRILLNPAFAAIKHIPYAQINLSKLEPILALRPDKQDLSTLMEKKLAEICPDIKDSKRRFEQVQQDVEGLYDFIRKQILTESDKELNTQFMERAHYYFEKEGKKVRPLMVYMLARNYASAQGRQVPKELWRDIEKWSAQIQIMHIASLAHDDIVDDSPSRRGQQSQHLKYGSKAAVFSGNYIISKASKTVASFNSPRLYEIYAHTMSSLAEGEVKQLIAKGQNKFTTEPNKTKQFSLMMDRYMEKSYFKSAALMCGALLGVPNIFRRHSTLIQLNMDEIEFNAFQVGQHYGLSLQLIDDILDYISTQQEMGKEEMSDLVQGNVTAPVYLTYFHKKQFPEYEVDLELLNKRKKSKEEAMKVKKWVESGVGIELTYLLAAEHVLEGLNLLKKQGFQSEEDLGAWRYLGHKLMTRRK